MEELFDITTYLFDPREVELQRCVDPRQDFVPPHEVGAVHRPYARRHSPFSRIPLLVSGQQ